MHRGDRMFSKFLIAAGAALLLAGCATDQGLTDRKGRSLSLDDEGSFEPAESRFNTFKFLDVSKGYSTQAYERDNGKGWAEIIKWDAGKAYFMIQYVNSAWLSRSTEDRALEGTDFREIAANAGIPEAKFQIIDQVSPRTKGWIGKNGDCVAGFFAKRFKRFTPYDNDRGYSDAIVEFAGCSKFSESPEAIMQGINLITEADEAQLAAAYLNIGPLGNNGSTLTSQQRTRTFEGDWYGVSSEIEGEVRKKGAAQFDFSFDITEADASCSGTAITGSGTGNTGTWKLLCDNGLKADGMWTKHEGQPIKGAGADSMKRRISFELKS